jgi:hypothetical protein
VIIFEVRISDFENSCELLTSWPEGAATLSPSAKKNNKYDCAGYFDLYLLGAESFVVIL